MLLFWLLGCVLGTKDDTAVECTEIGCEDGIFLTFSLTEAGDYTITAVAGGDTVTCTASLPFDGTEACDGPGYTTLSGTALPADQQSIEGLTLESTTAADVHLTIVRSGTTLYDDTMTVSYETSQPNGPACGPTCTEAALDVAL